MHTCVKHRPLFTTHDLYSVSVPSILVVVFCHYSLSRHNVGDNPDLGLMVKLSRLEILDKVFIRLLLELIRLHRIAFADSPVIQGCECVIYTIYYVVFW
ncbi:hypothetical protein BBBOND_0304630 [Babesia bigemina]|uniref:Uncharacterized protein n=1 Tax=Babesia bigemina TaxID=5866 RepID=A0A061DDT7_BABBI|nr:hypothetical protein BBBOND_0304630 [Babesia bigemina]CDR96560.1 hypothetical protein BBBOND_0304630 [Babesia bigemina]|eukprot:XP_012768746.1 hypothetical protein BBBOND_0304630 [Babesia bigemina]